MRLPSFKNVLSLLAILLLCSCAATVTQNVNHAQEAAFDGNLKNGGLSPDPVIVGGKFIGFRVTDGFKTRYTERVAKWGTQVKPVVKDATRGFQEFSDPVYHWLVTAEVIDNNAALRSLEILPSEPTPGWQQLLAKWGVL